MKEKFRVAREFICFYLALPLFVLMFLVAGVSAAGISEGANEYDVTHPSIKEEAVAVSAEIESEVFVGEGSFPIVARDLSKDYDVLNSTSITPDEEGLLKRALPYPYKEGVPLVLVVHTHATESYADEDESFVTPDEKGNYGFYTNDSKTRSSDTEKNIVAVGEVFCTVLSENGIGVIQCRTLNDEGDYNNAYTNSRKEILKYLEKYPSIKYVVDIHRDSLVANDGKKTKTLASLDEPCAQVMFVSGTIFNGWENNLSVALKIKKVMDEKYPSLSRPIYLRNSKYNLDLTKGSLLLEIGTCANTLDEAKRAAELAAECFAEVIKQ